MELQFKLWHFVGFNKMRTKNVSAHLATTISCTLCVLVCQGRSSECGHLLTFLLTYSMEHWPS